MPIMYLIHGQVNVVRSTVPGVMLPMKTFLNDIFYFCWLVLCCLKLQNYIKIATHFPYKMKFGDVHSKIDSMMTSDRLCFYTVAPLSSTKIDDSWLALTHVASDGKLHIHDFPIKMNLQMDIVSLLFYTVLAWNITL